MDIVRNECKNVVAVTLDIWSSSAKDSYVVVTFHWINDKWESKHVTADIISLLSPHTAENIATELNVSILILVLIVIIIVVNCIFSARRNNTTQTHTPHAHTCFSLYKTTFFLESDR
jgi:heme/copper-type cytochrome/quinol oxidase subunit 2